MKDQARIAAERPPGQTSRADQAIVSASAPRGLAAFCGAALLLGSGAAAAYPHGVLRPAGQIFAGPADGHVSAIHFNPAALRLQSGSHILAVAGAEGYLGYFQRDTPLPAGFYPTGSTTSAADPANIAWAVSDMMVAASWDLRTEAVTLGFGVYSPYNDQTQFAPRSEIDSSQSSATLQRLSTRYHAIADRTYSLWGTVAAGLRLRRGLFFGGGFQFAYTRSQMTLMRDLGDSTQARGSDGLPCASGICEQWSQRQLIDLDVSGWGYGFNIGLLSEILDNHLWLGASYSSPLLTSIGSDVPLDGRPTRPVWSGPDLSSTQPCGYGGRGARISDRDEPLRCGSARILRSFPHLIYIGARGRFDPRTSAADSVDSTGEPELSSQLRPLAIELSSWVRLSIPTRDDLRLIIENSAFPPGELPIPLGLRTAFAVSFGVREIWNRMSLAQELLYESPRSDPSAVSPLNLEGHKLDFSLAARIHLHRRLSLQFTVGSTFVFFEPGSGSGFSSDWATSCRGVAFDIRSEACQRVQAGWAEPSATGGYLLIRPHGVAGLELNL